MNTPSANDLLMARMAGKSNDEHLMELDHLSRHLEAELVKARAERDLAIAHDRQPYPTAAAYEAVCSTVHRQKAKINELRAALAEIWNITIDGKMPLTQSIHGIADGVLDSTE